MFNKFHNRSQKAPIQGMVIGDSAKKKAEVPTLAPLAPRKPFLRTTKGLLVAGLVVVALTGLVLFIVSQRSSKDVVGPKVVCSTDVLTRASKAINDADLNTTGVVASEIMRLKDYDRDMNCDYVLVTYALMQGDTDAAKQHLNLLRNAYTGSYNAALTIPQLTPKELDTLITNTETAQNAETQNDEQRQEDSSELDSAADKAYPGAQ